MNEMSRGHEAPPSGNARLDAGDLAYPSARSAWWSVAVLTALYALSLMDRQVIALMVEPIRADLGIDDFQIGIISGLAFAIFYATFGLLFGRLADRRSRRAIVFCGVLLWSFAAAGCGVAHRFWSLALARFGLGAGEAALNPAAYSMISDSFPRARLGFALSVFATGAQFGSALSMAVGGTMLALLPAAGLTLPLVGHLAPWRLTFILIGLPGLALAFLVWTLRDPPRRQRLVGSGTSLSETLAFMRARWRFFVAHFIGFGGLVAVTYSWQAWMPTYLIRRFGLSVGEIVAWSVPINVGAGVTGTLIAGWVVDRLFASGRTMTYLILPAAMGALQLLFIVLGIAAPTPALLFAAMFGVIAMTGCTGVAVAALQLVTPNDYRGQVSSAYLFCYNLIGMGVGPTLVGLLTAHVLADDAMVGWSIAAAAALLAPLSILALLSGRGPMRRALGDAQAWADRT